MYGLPGYFWAKIPYSIDVHRECHTPAHDCHMLYSNIGEICTRVDAAYVMVLHFCIWLAGCDPHLFQPGLRGQKMYVEALCRVRVRVCMCVF